MNYFKMNQFSRKKLNNGYTRIFIMIFGYWYSFEYKNWN
jgi:hypothetical protein